MRFAIPLLVVALPFAAIAAETSVDVRANIKGTCVISQSTPVNFGDLPQGTTAPDRNAPGSVNYWCTKGLVYNVTLGLGNHPSGSVRRMRGQASTNNTEYLPYELTTGGPVTGTGRGPGTPETLALTGTVRGTDYNTMSVGDFLDIVVVTIAP